MAHFTDEQFHLVINWLVDQMARQQGHHSWSVVKEDNVRAGLRAENPILTQYHGIINERQNRHPITGEMETKLRENLLAQLKQAAVEQEIKIARFPNDQEYLASQYSCIQLKTDHGPKDILAEVAKTAGIVDDHWPMKTWILIRPDGDTVDVYQNGKPDVHLRISTPTARLA